MRFRSFALTATFATLFVTAASVAEAQRGLYSSRSHGVTFGVSVGSAAVSTRGTGSSEDEMYSGSGVQMELGWHMLTSHFGAILDYANVSLDENDKGALDLRKYSHINLLGRYLFRSDRDIVRPYLELGIGHREVTAHTRENTPRSLTAVSLGGTLGGGMQVFLARPVALDLGLQAGLGGFDDWKNGGTTVTSAPELTQPTVAFRLGVRFWPGY